MSSSSLESNGTASTLQPLRYGIIGSGALGGYYGGLMAKAGLDVHFLFHSDFHHVKEHGLKVESKNGDFRLPCVHAYDSVDRMPPLDVVILGLKSTQNHELPRLLKPWINSKTIALVLQNGLNVEQATAEVFGPERIAGGCCFLCSNKVGPGHIRHLDYGRIVFGTYRGADSNAIGPDQKILSQIHHDMNLASIECHLTDDLPTTKWKKLMWNIPFNGLSVILNASTDAIMKDPNSRLLARRISEEVRSIACQTGSQIDPSYVDWVIDHTDDMVPYDSSMRLDFIHGRAIEVEAIHGNALRAAKRKGIPAPILETIYQQLKFLAAHRR